MSRILLWSALAVLLGVTTLLADEDTASSGEEIDALAARLMAVARVVEREHFDPPPRQELVHQLIRRLAARSETPPVPGMGRELSSLNDDAALEAALVDFCRELIQRQASNRDVRKLYSVERSVIQDMLRSLPGPNFVRSQKEHLVEEQFANNRYVGTGIALGLPKEPGLPQMHQVMENGPADKAGAKKKDLIVEIDGKPTAGLRLEEVIDRLRGPEGSDVTVKLQQPDEDEVRDLTITRGVVPFTHAQMTINPSDGSTMIVIGKLTAATVQELRDIEEQLDQSDKEVVLELPEVGGLELHHAVLLADALLDGGAIGRARMTDGLREFTASRDCLFRDRPLKIHVTGLTSGAVEWVVAALQDNGRATVVGQRTAGRPFITEAFEVPGTDWVLVLTCGVLERADGQRLLRTESPGFDAPAGSRGVVTPDGRLDALVIGLSDHDGGVVPDELVEPPQPRRNRRPVEPPEASDVMSFLKRLILEGPQPE